MVLDLNGVEVSDRIQWINTPGERVLKVIGVDEKKVTKNRNPVLTVKFQDRNGAQIWDDIVITQASLWRLKILTDALKIPHKIINTEYLVGRYVKAKLVAKKYDSYGEEKTRIEIGEYSPVGDDLQKPLEIPESEMEKLREEVLKSIDIEKDDDYNTPPELDIDDDEIPF